MRLGHTADIPLFQGIRWRQRAPGLLPGSNLLTPSVPAQERIERGPLQKVLHIHILARHGQSPQSRFESRSVIWIQLNRHAWELNASIIARQRVVRDPTSSSFE